MQETRRFIPRQETVAPIFGNLALQPAIQERKRSVGEGVVLDFEEARKSSHERMRRNLSWQSGTREYVDFFNRFYKEEGLPKDWQNLQYGKNQVGFSIKSQMDLLKGTDQESLGVWAGQTKRDMQGFIIEYLSPYNVYPWHHMKAENPDGTFSLRDTKYGKRMVDTVSPDERGGAVLEVLKNIDRAVIGNKIPDGSILVQVSPMDDSPTGLKQDNGEDVVYSDTHIIFSQVNNGKLDGFTVKTDYTKAECRELIKRLTGKVIPEEAPIEDYIRSVALINPEASHMSGIDDVISEVALVRSDLSLGSDKAYQDKTWQSVRTQVGIGDGLYEYTDHIQAILDTFEKDVIDPYLTDAQRREYIAATILRVSQEADSLKINNMGAVEQDPFITRGTTGGFEPAVSSRYSKFGDVLRDASLIPGCAGGGKTSVTGAFGISRAVDRLPLLANVGTCNEIACGGCSWKANEHEAKEVQKGNLRNCPSCGWSPKKAA